MTNTTGTLGFQPPDIEPMASKGVDEGTQSLERCESQTADRRQILRTAIKTFRSQTVDLWIRECKRRNSGELGIAHLGILGLQ